MSLLEMECAEEDEQKG